MAGNNFGFLLNKNLKTTIFFKKKTKQDHNFLTGSVPKLPASLLELTLNANLLTSQSNLFFFFLKKNVKQK